MGKRYFCDYCDRAFPDSAENRKKHLDSVHHQKLRKAHYDAFRDAATMLKDEMAKNPCRKFQQNGDCEYGASCKYSHLTPEDLQRLQEQAEQEKQGYVKYPRKEIISESDFKLWLEKVAKTKENQSCNTSNSSVISILPPILANIPNLPPSLIPSKAAEILSHEKVEWGR